MFTFRAGGDCVAAVTRGLRRLPMKDWLKLCVAAACLLAAATCLANFHTFRIEQIYSNARWHRAIHRDARVHGRKR
jgi:hypothetical protein